jgi:hypothetical protein
MAGGVVNVVGPKRTYEGRTTVYVALACVVAASGGLIFGYDIGISGTHISTTLYIPRQPNMLFVTVAIDTPTELIFSSLRNHGVSSDSCTLQ